jgi:hypothetical protein
LRKEFVVCGLCDFRKPSLFFASSVFVEFVSACSS